MNSNTTLIMITSQTSQNPILLARGNLNRIGQKPVQCPLDMSRQQLVLGIEPLVAASLLVMTIILSTSALPFTEKVT